MGVYCLLCGNRDRTVSYHRFPKDKHNREKWLSFCGITEEVLSTATFLCSNHFKEEDLKKKLNCVIVNPGAIPSIKARKRKKRSNTTDDKCEPPTKEHNLDEMSVVEAGTSFDNSQTAANTMSTSSEVNCQTPPWTVPEPPWTVPESPWTVPEPQLTVPESPWTVPEPQYVGDTNYIVPFYVYNITPFYVTNLETFSYVPVYTYNY